jgi:hypothetical protein
MLRSCRQAHWNGMDPPQGYKTHTSMLKPHSNMLFLRASCLLYHPSNAPSTGWKIQLLELTSPEWCWACIDVPPPGSHPSWLKFCIARGALSSKAFQFQGYMLLSFFCINVFRKMKLTLSHRSVWKTRETLSSQSIFLLFTPKKALAQEVTVAWWEKDKTWCSSSWSWIQIFHISS